MDDLSTMLTQYESMGNEYRLRSAQQLLIDGLASGKTTIIDPSKMNMLKKQKIEISLRNLASSIRENEALYDEYLQEMKRTEIIKQDCDRFASIQPVNAVAHSNENQSHNDLNVRADNILDKKIENLEQDNRKSEALLSGLMRLTGVRHVSVEACDDENCFDFIVQIQETKTLLRLTKEMKLFDILMLPTESLSPGSTDISPMILNDIIHESGKLSSPQDIRYAVFTITAAMASRKQVAADISELRKKCLVTVVTDKQKAAKQNTQDYLNIDDSMGTLIQISLMSGVKSTILIHYCYPQIPGCLKVVAIDSAVHSPERLQSAKECLNCRCFTNISSLYDELVAQMNSSC